MKVEYDGCCLLWDVEFIIKSKTPPGHGKLEDVSLGRFKVSIRARVAVASGRRCAPTSFQGQAVH